MGTLADYFVPWCVLGSFQQDSSVNIMHLVNLEAPYSIYQLYINEEVCRYAGLNG